MITYTMSKIPYDNARGVAYQVSRDTDGEVMGVFPFHTNAIRWIENRTRKDKANAKAREKRQAMKASQEPQSVPQQKAEGTVREIDMNTGYRITVQDGRIEVWRLSEFGRKFYIGRFNSVECAIEWVELQQTS